MCFVFARPSAIILSLSLLACTERANTWVAPDSSSIMTVDPSISIGESPSFQAKPGSAVISRNGIALVLDRDEPVVATIDASGKLVRVLGRRGQGPSETGSVGFVLSLASDTVGLVDPLRRRMLAFSSSGVFSYAIPVPTSSSRGSTIEHTIGRFADGNWVALKQNSGAIRSNAIVPMSDTPVVLSTGEDGKYREIIRLDSRNSIALGAPQNSSVSLSMLAPTSVTVCDSGLVVVDSLSVAYFDSFGRITSKYRRPIPRTPLDRELRERLLDAILSQVKDESKKLTARKMLREQASRIDSLSLPVIVDNVGDVWARVPSMTSVFAHFDATGRYVGGIRFREQYSMTAIGSGIAMGLRVTAGQDEPELRLAKLPRTLMRHASSLGWCGASNPL